ncbi:MAG: aldo/keto reductase [Verrucomicrobia bacterium]|nr:MAG: aldo/keto reductase [Verrucomicrobiota bacterium]
MTASALSAIADEATRTARTDLPRRPYRDNVELSIIGFGGIIVCGCEQEEANREVAHAIERGVNYFDVAPSYFEGEAERKLGIALKPYRKNTFLACKTTRRDAEGAREELEESLTRLHTDYFDLYQLHAVTTDEDVDQILAPGGALETFVRARDAGRVRYLGFSAHSESAALRLLDAFDFDSVLFPTNFVCFAQANFGPRVIEKAKERGAARLALKALAYTRLERDAEKKWKKAWYEPIDDADLARRALYFTLSEDITAAIPPGHSELFRIALDFATAFEPLSESEREALLAAAAGVTPLFPIP